MINAPAAYDTTLAEEARTPVYIARFEGGLDFGTARVRGDEGLSYGADTRPSPMTPINLTRSADSYRARFTVGELIIDIPDVDGSGTEAIASDLRGQRCEFYAGFSDGAFSEAPTLYSAASGAWQAVCLAGSGRLVKVGTAGIISTSDDGGATWTAKTAATSVNFVYVAYNGTTLVAIATGAAASGQVQTSTDNGATWQNRTGTDANARWSEVRWCSGINGGLFIAVGRASATNAARCMTSPTGVAWTASTIPVDAPKSIDYSDTLAVAAVCGVDGSSGFVFGVTDAMDPAGVAWSVLTTANEADRVRWSGGLGAFAFLRSSSGASFLWNANTAYALFAADSDSDLIGFTDFAWSEMDGRFLAVKTGYVMSSVDGRAWEPLATSEANEWRGVAATSPGFVGVGQTGSNRAFISTGGSDFIRTFTGIVSEVAQIDGVYRLSIRSAISKALTKELFTSSISALNGAIASGDMSLILDDASGLQADDGYIVIDDEILRYDGRSGNTLTIITRGALSTTAASHADNAKTVEGFYLDGDPVTVLTRVIAGSGQKTSLGMTTSDLDLLSLVDTLIAIGSTTSMAVFAIEPANGLAWLEKNIFSVLAAYPIENAQGQIGIKLLDTPSTFSDTLNDADIFARPRWLANQQNQINVVTYRYDLGSIDKEFATTRAERDSTAITAAGKEFTRTIDSAGLRAALSGTATFVDARIDSWLERFSGPCSAIEVEVMLQKELLEQGDDIEATFTVTPDPETGDREIVDAPMEITSIRQDFMANKIRFSLLGYPA